MSNPVPRTVVFGLNPSGTYGSGPSPSFAATLALGLFGRKKPAASATDSSSNRLNSANTTFLIPGSGGWVSPADHTLYPNDTGAASVLGRTVLQYDGSATNLQVMYPGKTAVALSAWIRQTSTSGLESIWDDSNSQFAISAVNGSIPTSSHRGTWYIDGQSLYAWPTDHAWHWLLWIPSQPIDLTNLFLGRRVSVASEYFTGYRADECAWMSLPTNPTDFAAFLAALADPTNVNLTVSGVDQILGISSGLYPQNKPVEVVNNIASGSLPSGLSPAVVGSFTLDGLLTDVSDFASVIEATAGWDVATYDPTTFGEALIKLDLDPAGTTLTLAADRYRGVEFRIPPGQASAGPTAKDIAAEVVVEMGESYPSSADAPLGIEIEGSADICVLGKYPPGPQDGNGITTFCRAKDYGDTQYVYGRQDFTRSAGDWYQNYGTHTIWEAHDVWLPPYSVNGNTTPVARTSNIHADGDWVWYAGVLYVYYAPGGVATNTQPPVNQFTVVYRQYCVSETLGGRPLYVCSTLLGTVLPVYDYGLVTGATNGATSSDPMTITTYRTEGLQNGDTICMIGMLGNTSACGVGGTGQFWIVQNVTDTTFDLYNMDGVTPLQGTGTWTSGGIWSINRSGMLFATQVQVDVNVATWNGRSVSDDPRLLYVCEGAVSYQNDPPWNIGIYPRLGVPVGIVGQQNAIYSATYQKTFAAFLTAPRYGDTNFGVTLVEMAHGDTPSIVTQNTLINNVQDDHGSYAMCELTASGKMMIAGGTHSGIKTSYGVTATAGTIVGTTNLRNQQPWPYIDAYSNAYGFNFGQLFKTPDGQCLEIGLLSNSGAGRSCVGMIRWDGTKWGTGSDGSGTLIMRETGWGIAYNPAIGQKLSDLSLDLFASDGVCIYYRKGVWQGDGSLKWFNDAGLDVTATTIFGAGPSDTSYLFTPSLSLGNEGIISGLVTYDANGQPALIWADQTSTSNDFHFHQRVVTSGVVSWTDSLICSTDNQFKAGVIIRQPADPNLRFYIPAGNTLQGWNRLWSSYEANRGGQITEYQSPDAGATWIKSDVLTGYPMTSIAMVNPTPPDGQYEIFCGGGRNLSTPDGLSQPIFVFGTNLLGDKWHPGMILDNMLGDVPTSADNATASAAAILATPANKLATDAEGKVNVTQESVDNIAAQTGGVA